MRRIAAWTVVLGLGAVLAVAVVVPRVAGARPYAVLTSSMRPGLPPGTLVVVRPVAVEDVAIGSVITYQLTSGEAAVVTHRVIGVQMNRSGERVFRTQGDANGGVDPGVVRPAQIRGTVWYAVPHLGYVERYLTPQTRQVTTLVVAGLLLLYALAMLAGSIRSDRHPRPGPRHSNGVVA